MTTGRSPVPSSKGSAATALRELALALEGGAVPLMLLGQLGWVARTKLAPARVPAAVEALFRTDLDLKTSAGDPRVLLERLVVELCGGPPVDRPLEYRHYAEADIFSRRLTSLDL